MSIREGVYKHPLLVKIIRFVYHDIIEGVLDGNYWYMIRYFFAIKHSEVKQLKEMGFEDIKIFKPKTWRIGNGLDKAQRRYYTARYSNAPCFIKIAEKDSTIQNEIVVADRIKQNKWDFTPNCFVTDYSFMGTRKMLAVSFSEGLHIIPDSITPDELKGLCADFVKLHESLLSANLVHADIHRRNLMLDMNNHLVLLDFGISKFLDSDNDVDYVARPGTFYEKTITGRLYDDAYSFIKMIEKLPACSSITESAEYLAVSNRIGLGCFEVIIQTKNS